MDNWSIKVNFNKVDEKIIENIIKKYNHCLISSVLCS